MGLLPSRRTTPAPPFVNVGIDFAGPFTLRQGYTKKPVLIKCYVVIFVCMFMKCVHLDVCASLSREDFLATLKRFTSRHVVLCICETNQKTIQRWRQYSFRFEGLLLFDEKCDFGYVALSGSYGTFVVHDNCNKWAR